MELIAKKFKELTTKELYEILKARASIFIVEQNISYQDMDNIDYDSLHCFFIENNKVIAYLRAFYQNNNVKIGRVLTTKHGHGIGKELMYQSIEIIKDKMPCQKIIMHAQKHAVSFYEMFGFKVTSKEFIEEGIVHVTMELDL